MSYLSPVITNAGFKSVFNASNDGFQATITHIALGDYARTPDKKETALRNERTRIRVVGGQRISGTQIRVNGLVDDDSSFWVYEIGCYLEDGTLFALWSDKQTPLAYKSSSVPLALNLDLVVDTLPEKSVTVQTSMENGAQLIMNTAVFITQATHLIRNSACVLKNAYLHLQALKK